MNWNHTMQIDEVCGYRTLNLTMTSRQKTISRTRTVIFQQNHEISLGKNLYMNYTTDMVMIHFKRFRRRDNPTPIINNPFVKHALKNELFGWIVFLYNQNDIIQILVHLICCFISVFVILFLFRDSIWTFLLFSLIIYISSIYVHSS